MFFAFHFLLFLSLGAVHPVSFSDLRSSQEPEEEEIAIRGFLYKTSSSSPHFPHWLLLPRLATPSCCAHSSDESKESFFLILDGSFDDTQHNKAVTLEGKLHKPEKGPLVLQKAHMKSSSSQRHWFSLPVKLALLALIIGFVMRWKIKKRNSFAR